MGAQQLLLIILAIFVVGLYAAIGFTIFCSHAHQANRVSSISAQPPATNLEKDLS